MSERSSRLIGKRRQKPRLGAAKTTRSTGSHRLPTVSSESVVAGIRISHPRRLIYPELSFSKLQLARYYEAIADWVVPHVRGRPLTLHCPAGVSGRCMYLKHAKAWGPSALRRVRIQEKTKIGEYLVADSLSAVVSLAQMGIVRSTHGTQISPTSTVQTGFVWDLDPGPVVPWKTIVAAAHVLREMLETLGVRAWIKTTGGQGVHVVVPIKPSLDWSTCLDFSRSVSDALVRTNPAHYTTAFSKKGREHKILIDYLRNNRTNTSICAYSPRSRIGAPVSTPVDWRELHHPPGQ